MRTLILILSLLIGYSAFAQDHFLRVTDYDPVNHRATLIMLDQSGLTAGTSLRIHTKMGTCLIKIKDVINESLVTETNDCSSAIMKTGMRLSYNMDSLNDWPEDDTPLVSDNRSRISFDGDNSFMNLIRNRLSVHLGYNFASNAEGKAYADGRMKDLEGDSTLAFGVLGRIYNFNPFIGLTLGLGHDFARNFDRATVIQNNAEVVQSFNGSDPRISIWNLSVQVEAEIIPKLNAFGGLNYSLPSIQNSPWGISGDIGFQAGAGYEVYPQVDVEGLIRMTNMNLKNDIGETTDISLTGLEVRGRYTF